MANKKPKQTSSTTKPRKNIVPIIMAIMAGVSLGISVTYIFMSQTGPLREEIRDIKKQYAELLKENEDLKRNKNSKSLNENYVKENTNLRNELTQKNREYENLKTQTMQLATENKELISKIQYLQKSYDKLNHEMKSQDDELANYLKSGGKPKEKGISISPNESQENITTEQKYVKLNGSNSFFNDEIFISVQYINYIDGKVSAVVTAPGYQEMTIDKGVSGKAYFYKTNKSYEIRIMGISGNFADFFVRATYRN